MKMEYICNVDEQFGYYDFNELQIGDFNARDYPLPVFEDMVIIYNPHAPIVVKDTKVMECPSLKMEEARPFYQQRASKEEGQ